MDAFPQDLLGSLPQQQQHEQVHAFVVTPPASPAPTPLSPSMQAGGGVRTPWEGRPIMNRVRVTLSVDFVTLSSTSVSSVLCINRRDLSLSTVPPIREGAREAEYNVYAVMGMMALSLGTHLVCVAESSCVATVDAKRIHRADQLTLVRVSASEGGARAEAAVEEAEEYCRFLALQFRFYFSPDFDFTHTAQRWAPGVAPDRRFFWNSFLAQPFVQAGHGRWVLAVTDAFVGTLENVPVGEGVCQYVLISRRGKRRAGTRYLCRGADLRGNVANFVETEQIVSRGRWLASFVQVRGSIPVVWHQRGDGLKPQAVPRFVPGWQWAHDRHVDELQRIYGSNLTSVSLVDYHGHEGAVGCVFEIAARRWNDANPERAYRFQWTDFHNDTKGGRYDRVEGMAERALGSNFDFFLRDERGDVVQRQSSVIRTNCIDCLDRTNVFQSIVAHRVLERQLAHLGLLSKTDVLARYEQLESGFKHTWADNADEMSRRYTGVGALKTDFTRTGKRTGKGLMQDGLKSVQRMAQHLLKDSDKQRCIEQFLGALRVGRARSPGQVPHGHAPFPTEEGAEVELDRVGRLLVRRLVPFGLEQRVGVDEIFSVARIVGSVGGLRLWLRTQPEPIKLVFRTTVIRESFLEMLASLCVLPQAPVGLGQLDTMIVTWSDPARPGGPEMFGHLPRSAAVVILCVQNVTYQMVPHPLVDSEGLGADWHFVSLFRTHLGLDFELIACTGGGGTRTAVFVRAELLPHVDAVHACLLGAVPMAASSASSVDTLATPTRTFSSLVKEKLSAVRQQLSQPTITDPGGAIGCALRICVLGVPLCILNAGPLPPPRDPTMSSSSLRYYLHLFGGQAELLDSYNVLGASPHTFWVGCAPPQQFDVSAWLCLATSESAPGHILCTGAVGQLLSSDPPGQPPQSSEGRGVACCFALPVHPKSGGVRVSISITEVVVRCLLGEQPSTPHLVLSSPCAADEHFGPMPTHPSGAMHWPGPFVMGLLLCAGGAEWVRVDVWAERVHLARGAFLVQEAFSGTGEISLSLRDSHCSLWGTCKLRVRAAVVPRTATTSSSSQPNSPAVPARGHRPAPQVPMRAQPSQPQQQRPPTGDLLDFGDVDWPK